MLPNTRKKYCGTIFSNVAQPPAVRFTKLIFCLPLPLFSIKCVSLKKIYKKRLVNFSPVSLLWTNLIEAGQSWYDFWTKLSTSNLRIHWTFDCFRDLTMKSEVGSHLYKWVPSKLARNNDNFILGYAVKRVIKTDLTGVV